MVLLHMQPKRTDNVHGKNSSLNAPAQEHHTPHSTSLHASCALHTAHTAAASRPQCRGLGLHFH
jgi:hypothetical protein